MKKLFITTCVLAFLGCSSQELQPKVSQALVLAPSALYKPMLKQVMPSATFHTPSRDLTRRVPTIKLQKKRLNLALFSPGAI